MPKQINEEELSDILDSLLSLTEATLGELSTVLPIKLNQRTLQRRLALLIKQKKISKHGQGPKSRYRVEMLARKKMSAHQAINISLEGKKILRAIKRPLTEKKPVGYQRKFLDAYHPNKSFYLTEKIKNHLHHLGKVTQNNQPAGTYAKQIFQRLLIDLSWNSSRLEGNTYSLLETQALLELGKIAVGKDAQETQMIVNHKEAISFLIHEAEYIGFNRYTILNLHAILSDNLLGDPSASGRLRTVPVGIGKTVYLPLQIPQLIEECFQQILDTAKAINDPFEQSFFVTVHLPYLQPFIDVNKRVSRLSANIPLIQKNLCPLSYVDVPHGTYIDGILGVYELNQMELLRDVYVWSYERSCMRYSAIQQTLGEPNIFRLKHHALVANIIHTIIKKKLNKQKALQFIRTQAAKNFKDSERNRFIELIETELMCLHEGSIARYHINFAAYHAWQEKWNG